MHAGLSSSSSGISYQLVRSGSILSTLTGSGGSLDFGSQTIAGTYTIIALNAVTTCTANMSGSAVVVVNSLPTIYPVTGGGAYCSGGTGVHILLSNSDGAATTSYLKKAPQQAFQLPAPAHRWISDCRLLPEIITSLLQTQQQAALTTWEAQLL